MFNDKNCVKCEKYLSILLMKKANTIYMAFRLVRYVRRHIRRIVANRRTTDGGRDFAQKCR